MARPPRPPSPPNARPAATAPGTAAPRGEEDIERLQSLLDAVPAPLEPLDVSMLDGFLCAIVVQPQPVPPARWLPHVVDVEGRRPAAGVDIAALQALVLRRHAELAAAVGGRQWFDPWVFEMAPESDAEDDDDEDEDDEHDEDDEDDEEAARAAVYPWVAGFATAFDLFPALSQAPAEALLEPLALLYRHLDPADLEDDPDLQDEIESLEPPADLADAVEGLVRATLLLADVSGAAVAPPAPPRRRPRR
jgi:uncharacterized protein